MTVVSGFSRTLYRKKRQDINIARPVECGA